jgi:hypothetical protein
VTTDGNMGEFCTISQAIAKWGHTRAWWKRRIYQGLIRSVKLSPGGTNRMRVDDILDLIDTAEAARILDCSIHTVRRAAREGTIPAFRLHKNAPLRFRRSELLKLAGATAAAPASTSRPVDTRRSAADVLAGADGHAAATREEEVVA